MTKALEGSAAALLSAALSTSPSLGDSGAEMSRLTRGLSTPEPLAVGV